MREEAIAQRVGHRTGLGKRRSGAAQRVARREHGIEPETFFDRLRSLLGFVSVGLKVIVGVLVLAFLFIGYRSAASANFFQVHNVEVKGTSRVSADEVEAIVRREVGKSGVWRADVKGLSAKLGRLPWVRTAVVSRVLPDSIRVRIAERTPRAVVRLSTGRFRWVDDEAMLLGEMVPADQMPAFFLRGWNEDDSEDARKENVERVGKFLEIEREWTATNIAERVSEVNLIDTHDVRAQLGGDDAQIEVRLGGQDFGKRLAQALDVLDQQRHTPRGPYVSYIDLSQGKRAIVGFVSGTRTTSSGPDATAPEPAKETPSAVAERKPLTAAKNPRNNEKDKKNDKKRDQNTDKAKKDAKSHN